MRVRRVGPHEIWLRWIGVGGIGQAHRFRAWSNNHDVGASSDPVIICGLLCCEGVGVAGAIVAAEHVGDPVFVGRVLMFHPRAEKGHAVGIGAHGLPHRDHAGETVLAFPQRLHIAVLVAARNTSVFRN